MKAVLAVTLAVACLVIAHSQASAQIYVRTYAGDRGFIAPDSLAKIEGAPFVEEAHMPVIGHPLPLEIGGVRVWLGKTECGLRSVAPGFIVFLVPPSRYGWQILTVQSPLGWRSTLVAVLPLARAFSRMQTARRTVKHSLISLRLCRSFRARLQITTRNYDSGVQASGTLRM